MFGTRNNAWMELKRIEIAEIMKSVFIYPYISYRDIIVSTYQGYLLFSLQYMGLYVFNWPISV